MPLVDMQLTNGLTSKVDENLLEVNLADYLGQFTKGNTFLEAARALYESDMYQNMEGIEVTSYGPDAPKGEKRRQPAYLMMKAAEALLRKADDSKAAQHGKPSGLCAGVA